MGGQIAVGGASLRVSANIGSSATLNSKNCLASSTNEVTDVTNLRKNNLCPEFDGNIWIKGEQKKTGVKFNIPLLNVAQMILDKYAGTLGF